ncbi:MAG: radical SAM protein [Candidatus Omnitrophota bacterium]
MRKNVLLIHPKSGFEIEKMHLFMPMGLMCIAAPLLELDIEVTLLDQRLEKDFYWKLKLALKNNPICVGITTLIGTQILYAIEVADFVRKNSEIPIVWGGVHPSLTPDQTIRNDNVDIVVRGEGDITFKELVDALDKRRSLKNIKGITWKKGDAIYHNPEREFCNLDELPKVPYHLLDVERYFVATVPGSKRCLNVYSSRGCLRGCIFCYNTKFNRSIYRKRSIDKVIEEIEWLKETYNIDAFAVNDDNFTIDADRTHYFCRRLIEKNIDLPWKCQGMEMWQAEKIDFDLLQKSGCKRVLLGLESGSGKVLKFLKRIDTPEVQKRVINKFAKSKLIAHYDVMIGYPVEGDKELAETLDLVDYIRKIDPKAYFTSFHIFTVFPGTEFCRIAIEKYGFTPPTTLEGWQNFRLEEINNQWILPERRSCYLNLCLISFFIADHRFKDKVKSKWILMFLGIFAGFAKYRWRRRQFDFCPEFKLLGWLMNYRIRRKNKQLREKCLVERKIA